MVDIIEVKRESSEQKAAASWVVARRYSEFHALNKRLRAKYPAMRHLEFPRRQVVYTFQKQFLRKRKGALEKYLQSLLNISAVCQSREFRAFLSQRPILTEESNGAPVSESRDFVSKLYESVADGMIDVLGAVPLLDQVSLVGQNLIAAAVSHLDFSSADPDISDSIEDASAMPAIESNQKLDAMGEAKLEPFVKPICDIIIELFGLDSGNSWLGGRTVVMIVQQVFGDTLERRVRDRLRAFLIEERVCDWVRQIQESIWPNGQLRPGPIFRSEAEKLKSRRQADLVLRALLPDVIGSVVGRSAAETASRRATAAINNQRLKSVQTFNFCTLTMLTLNRSVQLLYSLLDEVASLLFRT